jgi:hypothetical protein
MGRYLNVSVHDVLAVQVGEGLADILEVAPDFPLGEVLGLEFLKEGAPVGVLEHHVGDFAVAVDVDVEQLDDLGVGESVVHDDLVLGDLIDLA